MFNNPFKPPQKRKWQEDSDEEESEGSTEWDEEEWEEKLEELLNAIQEVKSLCLKISMHQQNASSSSEQQ